MAEFRRFPAPWTVERPSEDAFVIKDANGITVAYVYSRDDLQRWSFGHDKLTSDEARRIAMAIARIPEFMMQRRGFYSRGGGDKRWKPSRPYHVALEDGGVRKNWDEINALCKHNGIPFDPTGEIIRREGVWCVYEFARQLDAMMFWEHFQGRWLRDTDFFYPDRPEKIPAMKPVPNLEKILGKWRR
jgi:hypothetical protein